MDDWERHVTPLLQDMGCANEDAQDDFFNQQDVSDKRKNSVANHIAQPRRYFYMETFAYLVHRIIE